jgi:hypothetical protein
MTAKETVAKIRRVEKIAREQFAKAEQDHKPVDSHVLALAIVEGIEE